MPVIRQASKISTRAPSPRQDVRSDLAAHATPAELTCPLSGKRFERAVRAPDGQAYEESALRSYLADHDNVLPSGVAVDPRADLRADYNLRDQVDRVARGESLIGDGDEVPEHLTDPVSMAEFADPVVASDGRTYDLDVLKRIFEGNRRSPFTRELLAPVVYRNATVRHELGLPPVSSDLAASVRMETERPRRLDISPERVVLMASTQAGALAGMFGGAGVGALLAAPVAAVRRAQGDETPAADWLRRGAAMGASVGAQVGQAVGVATGVTGAAFVEGLRRTGVERGSAQQPAARRDAYLRGAGEAFEGSQIVGADVGGLAGALLGGALAGPGALVAWAHGDTDAARAALHSYSGVGGRIGGAVGGVVGGAIGAVGLLGLTAVASVYERQLSR